MDNLPGVVRGIRGATTVTRDEPPEVLEATRELLAAMLRENDLDGFDPIAAVHFTVTDDIHSTFPAEAARELGMNMVPLICHQEMSVPGRLPRCIRVLMLVNTDRPQDEMRHVYLREATSLRPDLRSAQ